MNNIILLDGAMGTELWKSAEAAGIHKAPVWTYNITAPQLVKELHNKYISAGTQIICTNTFSANIPAVKSEGFDWQEVISKGVKFAREAADQANADAVSLTKDSRKIRVALDLGPLFSPLDPFGDTTEEACHEIYKNLCEEGSAA